MEKKGLCSTCIQSQTCIFSKESPVVWQCEEFYSTDNVPAGCSQVKTKRIVSCESAAESE